MGVALNGCLLLMGSARALTLLVRAAWLGSGVEWPEVWLLPWSLAVSRAEDAASRDLAEVPLEKN